MHPGTKVLASLGLKGLAKYQEETLGAYRCCPFYFSCSFPFCPKHSCLNFPFSARDLFLVTEEKAMLMGSGVVLYACQVAVYSLQGPQNCLKQFRVR